MSDKAILLGINSYKSVSRLRGCENDVLSMRELLTGTYRFETANVKIALHTEVTKARVKQLMKWLYQDTQEGDRLLFHFSGHGSYTADLTGDEADVRDELICLYDMDFSNKESYFIDDELRDWTLKLPKNRHLVVVLDNCHSGTGTRKILPPESTRSPAQHPAIIVEATDARRAARGLNRSLTPGDEFDDPTTVIARFVEPPPSVLAKVRGLKPRGMLRREVTRDLNHVLLAACGSDQTAADAHIDGQFRGAFTYNLCKILSSAGVGLSRKELIAKLSSALSANHFDQVPQFEGPSDKGPLFAPREHEGDARPTTGAAPVESLPVYFESHESGSPPNEGGMESGRPSATHSASDLPRRIEEFLAAYNRVLAAGGAIVGGLGGLQAPAAEGAGLPARGASLLGQKVVVYVHGICEHSRGFSDPWWAALAPFAPALRPGDLGDPGTTTARRYEVVWSDIVRGGGRDLAEATPARAARQEETRQRLVEILEDRARQQAVAFAAAQPAHPGAERALETAIADRSLLGIPGLDCIGDFVQYLEDPAIRQQVQGRFLQVVGPLLRAGAQVEVISHSWGTVVAYESLCLMENVTPRPPGGVANLFTVGSALSIGYVRSHLIDAAADGHRPRVVRNWVNLDARGDVVGGPLRGFPFAVDQEFLNLDPVGCNSFFPSPACAHGSYFDARNLGTNRDIFGRFIGS